ncbi:MAG: hypothetical protein J6D44_06140 [Pseudomonas sp.]|nr:hypothetical protein [Pseudomonas sp.]
MKTLIVPEIAARESSFVRPGEIQVVGYKEHLEDISRLLDAQDKILAYDEAKERELFTAFAMEHFLNIHRRDNGDYFYTETRIAWSAWKSCAKSRARSAE